MSVAKEKNRLAKNRNQVQQELIKFREIQKNDKVGSKHKKVCVCVCVCVNKSVDVCVVCVGGGVDVENDVIHHLFFIHFILSNVEEEEFVHKSAHTTVTGDHSE